MNIQELKEIIRDVHDFPRPGIVFKDITPLLAHPKARDFILESIVKEYQNQSIDALVAIEARGFIFGSLIASALKIPFIPVRKEGKLPYKTIKQHYELEYGTSCIEIHEDALKENSRVLLHDDLLATGGTALAAAELISKLKCRVVDFSFIVNLSFLPGEKLILSQYSKEPHYVIKY